MTSQRTGGGSGGGPGGARRGRPRYFPRRKVCGFCVDHITHIDYKNLNVIRRFVSEQSKIESRRKSGVCSKHQRSLSTAIKRARHLGMVPFSNASRGQVMRRGG
ncbi:30S ribosomal protein S18 [Dehalococcoidia bacterium]|nr:30S ribosomal protein S18 [Dehalococcoidia bacterium]